MENILEVKNICKTYQAKNGEIEALKDINFKIEEGEYVSIIGPSGCGKSTLLSIIAGLENKTSGTTYINGKIGYMLQKDNLLEWRTVLNNVFLGLEIQRSNTPENKKYVIELLKKYGLYEFKDKYPNQLSGGMRQRVALIRTLAIKPKILLLDEAFSALDYQTRLMVTEDIYKILKNEGITALMVTHDISEAIAMSDKIVVLTHRPAKIKAIIIVICVNKISNFLILIFLMYFFLSLEIFSLLFFCFISFAHLFIFCYFFLLFLSHLVHSTSCQNIY